MKLELIPVGIFEISSAFLFKYLKENGVKVDSQDWIFQARHFHLLSAPEHVALFHDRHLKPEMLLFAFTEKK